MLKLGGRDSVIYFINYYYACFWCGGYFNSDEGVEGTGVREENYYSTDYDEHGGVNVCDSVLPCVTGWDSRSCRYGAGFLADFNLDNAI